jgi:hypothetical protein
MPRKTAPKKNPGGRPKKYDLEVVTRLSRVTCPDSIIAERFGVTIATVKKWRTIPEFKKAVLRGEALGRLEVRSAQMKLALKGDAKMLKFLGKQYLGQSSRPGRK